MAVAIDSRRRQWKSGQPLFRDHIHTTQPPTNIVWHPATVSRQDREALRGHGSAILWFTGLSGSGKSTMANGVNGELHRRGVAGYVLDGDKCAPWPLP